MSLALKPYLFQKGKSGNPGGRPRNQVKEILEEMNTHPVREIMKLLEDTTTNKKIDVWLELLSYVQGRPKEVEASLSTEELVEMLEARLPPKVG